MSLVSSVSVNAGKSCDQRKSTAAVPFWNERRTVVLEDSRTGCLLASCCYCFRLSAGQQWMIDIDVQKA